MFESAIALCEPVNVYKPIAVGIGIADGRLVCMSYPGLSFLKLPFPTRMTIVRLAGGGLWLHSPIAYDAALASALSAMGPVRHLVSPNKLHYEHLGAWSRAFPEATVWASPGLRERARARGLDLRFDEDLGPEAPEAWGAEIAQTIIPGSYLDEVAFFHRASKTLILTDTIQSFELAKLKQPYRFLVWLSGAYAGRGQMPIDLRATFSPHRRSVRRAVETMLSWGPERVVVSHGRCIEQDAPGALRYAFRWAF